ncbi:hypothetical protein M407DRAFT_34606 [Tulasnella calospora MUT 4182]|uniref:EF-hand domain-containing protein n=1 Tax=Tulasnella calospora MUT 4182 TaxID=1051891 RepID=A0A0C3L259_9AGAM|nr:hypothetical protein M407DRAFT_34606 [Tulasnella calospora MUT 4182]
MYILTAFVFYILPSSYPSLTYFSSLEDHDGKITWEEFWQGAKENLDEGVVLSEEEARKTFNEWDMNEYAKRGSSPEIMKDLWERFDEDKDGYIVKADVVRFFERLFGPGQIDDTEPLNVIFDEYDTDHDGKLNFEGEIDLRFFSFMSLVHSL